MAPKHGGEGSGVLIIYYIVLLYGSVYLDMSAWYIQMNGN